jgi:hypothetical protein
MNTRERAGWAGGRHGNVIKGRIRERGRARGKQRRGWRREGGERGYRAGRGRLAGPGCN